MRLWLGLLTSMLVAALIVAGCGAWLVKHWWEKPLPLDGPGIVVVAPGSSAARLARDLEDGGLLEPAWPLPVMMRLRGEAAALQAGEYAILPGESLAGLMARIVAGNVVHHRIRFLEGARIADVLAQLAADERLGHTLAGARSATLLAELDLDLQAEGADTSHGEGWFFPDTYSFIAGESDRDLLLRAHAKMLAELNAVWAARPPELPYQTPYDALKAASIIEKETFRAEDRRHVSQVLVARLGRNMRLQVDPTVIYGLGDFFDGDLTRAQLRFATPYNTYVHKGLPPTPIALPGRGALEAAVNPSGSPYLYFVSRGDGTSEFSRTLAEHNAAVRRFQLNKRGAGG